MTDPFHPPDDETRAQARAIATAATHGALGTLLDGAPMVTRAGCLWLPGRGLGLLLSDLSDHARALAANPAASILLGEAGAKGDPLTHARLTLTGPAPLADKDAVRDHWLAARPKATLYFDFTDFRLRVLTPRAGLLNAGFGKAVRLAPADLGLPVPE